MALTKDKKHEVVDEVKELLNDSKLTVIATYAGTPVKAMQSLRQSGEANGTKVKVIKNRLVIKAIESTDKTKGIDTSTLNGMLLYAFNPSDEVAPAQTLANFAKTQPTIEFVGAITNEGQLIGPDDVKALADLPSKDQLRAMLVGTIKAPLGGFVNVMSGNIRGVLSVLSARAESIQ